MRVGVGRAVMRNGRVRRARMVVRRQKCIFGEGWW